MDAGKTRVLVTGPSLARRARSRRRGRRNRRPRRKGKTKRSQVSRSQAFHITIPDPRASRGKARRIPYHRLLLREKRMRRGRERRAARAMFQRQPIKAKAREPRPRVIASSRAKAFIFKIFLLILSDPSHLFSGALNPSGHETAV
jgi:hypothetical protein